MAGGAVVRAAAILVNGYDLDDIVDSKRNFECVGVVRRGNAVVVDEVEVRESGSRFRKDRVERRVKHQGSSGDTGGGEPRAGGQVGR